MQKKIGIISDTHGQLIPEVISALKGCEAILHAGDVGSREILEQLEILAPVYAVRGNCDGAWAKNIPVAIDKEICGLRVFITHRKTDLPKDLGNYDLAVFGHSHRYEQFYMGRTLILNPGTCTPKRFSPRVSMAIIEADGKSLAVSRIDIGSQGAESSLLSDNIDIKACIKAVMKETQKGHSPSDIARRHHIDQALAEQIARLYVTHPGVDADGIMEKLGL